MNKTKEEIITPEDFIDANYHVFATDPPYVLRCDKTKEKVSHQEVLEKYTTHLTDQTKSMEEQLKYCHNRMAEAYSELNEKEKPLTDKIFDLANELAIEGYADEAIKMHGIHNLISNKEMRKFSRD